MRKTFLAVAVIAGFCVTGLVFDTAEARPKYLGVFAKTYPDLKAEVGKVKCGVCHPEKDKKVRNEYAMAVGKNLPMKNTKDADAIGEAIKKAEDATNSEGKKFGDIIGGGSLPN